MKKTKHYEQINFSMVDMKKENGFNINDVNYEKACLNDMLEMLKLFNRDIYLKAYSTGMVSKALGQAFGVKEIQYYLAGFYANIGNLGITQITQNKDFLTREEKKMIKLHPSLSRDFLIEKELYLCAYIAYHHHEYPDGSGYYKVQKISLREVYLIHIADIFVGCLMPKNYRPAYSKRDAQQWAMEKFSNYPEFEKDQEIIEKVLLEISLPEIGI